MEEVINLNLACGNTRMTGFIGVDITPGERVDVVHDLKKPLPWKDETVSIIFASHIIEHFWYHELDTILKDWCRVLKPKGKLDIWTPNFRMLIKLREAPDKVLNSAMLYMNWRIFNRDREPYDRHNCVLTQRALSQKLIKVGFNKAFELTADSYPVKRYVKLNGKNYERPDWEQFGMRAIK